MTVRLLVTGAGTGPAENLIRSLRAGAPAARIVGCHDDRFALRASSADTKHLLPPSRHRDRARALRALVRREKIDLLIPTSDADVKQIGRARLAFGRRVFLPRTSVIELCQDKYQLNILLRERGVPAPLTYPVTSLATIAKTFARLPPRSLVWCRARVGSGALAALPVRSPAQARSWIEYWRDMRNVPPTTFTLSEYLPGRDFSCLSLWDRGALILLKTCQRLSYFTGGGNPSGISSVSHLAKTVAEPEVARVCGQAIRALDRRATGTFNLDIRENGDGVPCITEINAGRFPSGNLIHALTGKHNLSATFVRLALGERVGLRNEYDADEGWYTVRDLDTPMGIFHVEDLFDKIEDARG